MDTRTRLIEFKQQLDHELTCYLDSKIIAATQISPFAAELMQHIAELTLRGGKRIRAALLYYSYQAHGGADLSQVLHASMATEMSETGLLIQDDIMDNDSLRRGGITINAQYRQLGKTTYLKQVNSTHFGNSIAMMAGDIAMSLSNEILTESHFESDRIVRALNQFNQIYTTEFYGQVLDMLTMLKDEATLDDVLLVHRLKTAPYTFDGPVKIGAILAGADNECVAALEGYSIPLGIAFQIYDDVLGLYGSKEKIGKPVISDLQEGKKTLLILEALRRGNAHQRAIIENTLGRRRITIRDLNLVQQVVADTGSLEYSRQTATHLVQQAITALTPLDLKPEGKAFLLDIADFIINREY